MEQTRYFLITCGIYYDCPTCDSYGSDPDDIRIERVEGLDGIKNFIKDSYGTYRFYDLHELLDYGEIKPLGSFTNDNYGHRVQRVKFTLDGAEHWYGHKNTTGTDDWWTEAEKVLFSK